MKKLTKYRELEIKKRLVVLFEQATQKEINSGKNWYLDAYNFANELSIKHEISLEKCANVISALSPNSKWSQNKISAQKMIENFKVGNKITDFKVQTFNSNKFKAWNVLERDVLIEPTTKKTYAFQNHIQLIDCGITIDLWHLRACFGYTIDEPVSKVNYQTIEKITLKVAKDLGLKGFEFQAIIWLVIQRLFKY